MKSLQVQNGDLVVNQGSLNYVNGSPKLIQALTLWLLEPLEGAPPIGPGYTTPSFGSILTSFVGEANTALLQTQVKSEVLRILGLYQQNQYIELQAAQSVAALGLWSKSEIIQKINAVNVTASSSTITVNIQIQTLANNLLPLNLIINQNGITVS